MGLTVHFEVLNQLGTPMMYSETLANRPAPGIAGRIFFRTDSPYGIFRDTGSAWDQIGTGTVISTNIYNSNGTLTGNRTVNFNNNSLNFNSEFTFTPNNGSTAPTLDIFNPTFGGRLSLGYGLLAVGGGQLSLSTGGQNININNQALFVKATGNTIFQNGGTFVDAGFRVDIQGTLRATGDFQFGSSAFIGTAVGFRQTTSPAVGSPYYYMYASGDLQRTGVQINHRSDATGLMVGTTTNNVSTSGVGTPTMRFNGGPLRLLFGAGANHLVGNIAVVALPTNTNTFTIATSVQDYHDFSYMTSGSYFIGGNSGLPNGNVQNYFFGGGNDNTGNTQAARSVTFYSTFPYNITDSPGGNFTITGGRGTGAGTAGDVIFATSTALASGTTLQTLSNRWFIKGNTGVLSNTSTPYAPGTFALDLNGGLLIKNTTGTTAQLTLINADPSIGGNNGFLVQTVGGTSGSSYVDFQGYYGTSITGSTALRLNPSGGPVIVNSTTNTGEQLQITGTLRVNGQRSGSAGGASGQHLIINCDGVSYKIALLNP